MNVKILKLLEKNARITNADIATITGLSVCEVEKEIASMEKEGVLCGYRGIVNWEKVSDDRVSAIIELKVAPKARLGFEEVAERVAKYPEVESVSLMSGGYDLSVVVRGKTFREIAMFVSRELAVIESVTSTATQFVLRRYKEFDTCLFDSEEDGRDRISL